MCNFTQADRIMLTKAPQCLQHIYIYLKAFDRSP